MHKSTLIVEHFGSAMADGVDLSRKFVSESELDEIRKKRQEEWEKVRKPDDPEEAPEEAYDPRSLFERLQEQKDKKQEEYEEQFKFKNMVKGLDEDESSFLDEVSRQQSLIEKHRRDEEAKEIKEYRISFCTLKYWHVLLKKIDREFCFLPESVSMFTFVKLMVEASAVKRNDGWLVKSKKEFLYLVSVHVLKQDGPKRNLTH
ncbi:PSME3-interacting protein isoform a [Pimephales promelas]|nr:PSME3-interacting protein isoform a [Pimephales promelas]